MDQASPRTLLEHLVRTSRRTVDENCAAFERTASAHNEKATLSPRQLWRWMAGQVVDARPVAQRVAEMHWGHPFEVLTGPPPNAQLTTYRGTPADTPSANEDVWTPALSVVEHVERLRQAVHDAVSTGSLTNAGLDEWEETVARHGHATRYRPARLLLCELSADVAELQRAMTRRHTSTAMRASPVRPHRWPGSCS